MTRGKDNPSILEEGEVGIAEVRTILREGTLERKAELLLDMLERAKHLHCPWRAARALLEPLRHCEGPQYAPGPLQELVEVLIHGGPSAEPFIEGVRNSKHPTLVHMLNEV